MSDPLVAFLRSCLDEDARMALAAKNALDEWQAGNDLAQRWSVDHDAPLGVYVAGEWCCVGEGVAAHIGAQSPEQRLAEVESKRRILDLHRLAVEKESKPPFNPYTGERAEDEFEVTCSVCGWASTDPSSGCETLRLMTLPYVDRPGYDPAWGSASDHGEMEGK